MKDDVMNWEKEILQTIVLVCYADPHPQEGKEDFRSSQDEMGGASRVLHEVGHMSSGLWRTGI